jgi:hypothetical protein
MLYLITSGIVYYGFYRIMFVIICEIFTLIFFTIENRLYRTTAVYELVTI